MHSLEDVTTFRQMALSLRALKRHYRLWLYDDLSEVSQSMALKETHLPRLMLLTTYMLCGSTVLFIVWASLAPIKELARTEGQVLPSGYSQLVQHLEGGLVREILVHEGDFVQKNQVLVKLDGAGLEEDFREQQLLVNALSLHAERIKALIDKREPVFTNIEATKEAAAEQLRMFETTRMSQESDLAVLDEQIAQKDNTITRLRETLASSQRSLKVAKESNAIYAGLNAKGLAARTTYLKKQQELNNQEGEVNALAMQIEEAKKELSEFQRRRESMVAQQRDNAYSELHKVEAELAQNQETLKKRNGRVNRLEVRSPVAGYVKGLRLNTIGSVIPAGQTLMEVVPVDEQLIVEARILPQQIGRVAIGQEVQVKVDSYDYVRFGTIPGTLESLSAMTFTDEAKGVDYYKGRVRLTRNYVGLKESMHKVLPGMTVDADIVTGEKSILGYLLKPIQVALHNAMTEQ
jgi:HlyD family secretion protein/adhesin transport system membrane fusion protein